MAGMRGGLSGLIHSGATFDRFDEKLMVAILFQKGWEPTEIAEWCVMKDGSDVRRYLSSPQSLLTFNRRGASVTNLLWEIDSRQYSAEGQLWDEWDERRIFDFYSIVGPSKWAWDRLLPDRPLYEIIRTALRYSCKEPDGCIAETFLKPSDWSAEEDELLEKYALMRSQYTPSLKSVLRGHSSTEIAIRLAEKGLLGRYKEIHAKWGDLAAE